MSATTTPAVLQSEASGIDQRVVLPVVSWDAYESLLASRGECSSVRITYLAGEMELMTPSQEHERQKTRLARLIEAYAEEAGVELEGIGSWTIRDREQRRGAEPDECYVVGPVDTIDAPDFVIEVVWTSGGVDKLEVWRGLGVSEVWLWQDGRLRFFQLERGTYVSRERSLYLPGLDPRLVAQCMASSSQTAAVAELRRAIREQSR